MKTLKALLILSLIFLVNLQAQFKLGSEVTIEEPPYEINFKNEVPYIASLAGLLGTGILLFETNKKDPFTLEEINLLDRNDINGFDRGATFNSSKSARSASDILYLSGFALPYVSLLAKKNTRYDLLPLFALSAEAFLFSGVLNFNSKYLFNRTRPYVYNEDFPLKTRTSSSGRLSFFSGHTALTATSTFFVAKVISDYNPDMKKGLKLGLWTTASLIPAAVAYLRVESGRHYNTDVITGYAIGATIGYLIPHLHRVKTKNVNIDTAIGFNGMNVRLTF